MSIADAQNLFSLASANHFGFCSAVADHVQYEGITGLTGRRQPSLVFSKFFEGTSLLRRVLSSSVQFNKHLLGAMGSRMIEKCCLSERCLKSVGKTDPNR